MFIFVSLCILCVHSSFAIILKRKRKLVALAIIVLQMYSYYKCSLALPHGAMGWSAVCNCGIFPDHTHLFFGQNKHKLTHKSHSPTLILKNAN